MKGKKLRMNHRHRSDCNALWFARRHFLTNVPECFVGTKQKILWKNWIAAFITILCSLATVSVMAGCNTSAKTSSQSQTPVISVAITQFPPTTMVTGNSATVQATVSNDPANAGIDWVAICASAPNCGTFAPSHTASGASAVFTAPPGVPSGKTISVTALSTTDRSKSSSTSITITSTVTGIVINPPLPSSAAIGSILQLGATVAGDPANLGANWTVYCPTPIGVVACASLHSIAGGTVAFTIPSAVTIPGTTQTAPLLGASLTITAFATADHSFSTSSILTVTAPITISVTEAPPTTLLTNATAPVIAVVSNDTSNAGVTWVVSCAQSACGTIAPTQTASGVAATYTAPSTVPSPNPAPGLAVTITVYATATGPLGVSTTVTVDIVAPLSVSITEGIVNNTIVENVSAPLIATVSNDNSNAGVDWTVTCGSPGACGTISPAHTASGAATTYTAPSAPPSGNTVTITATSTANPTTNAQQTVTVTTAPPPNSLLQGQFVLYLSAQNSKNGPFVFGGVISGDGNGNIVGGSFDLADGAGNAVSAGLLPIISPSTYSLNANGYGQIQITLNTVALNTTFGVPVARNTCTLTLSVQFVSPQHALLMEADAFGNATGTIDLQNASDLASFQSGSAGLNGTYSLQLTGNQLATGHPGFFAAAAITSQVSGSTLTFTGYTADQSANGVITSAPFTTGSQSFSNSLPSSTGEISLTSVNLGLPNTFSPDFWLIDANHFVVTDFFDATASSPILVGGYLTAQPATPSVSGTFAFTEAGATAAAQPQVAGGILACGSAGTLDVVPLGGTGLLNQAISSSCTAPSNGRGLISISGSGSSGISQFAVYPTLDRGLYLIELDGGTTGTSGPSGAGVLYQQTLAAPISSSALDGTYASVFSANTSLGSQSFVGEVTADGVSNLSGTEDVNSYATASPAAATPSLGASLTGPFTTVSNGRFTFALTLTPATGQPAPQVTVLNPACYIVDANTCLLLGLDATAPGTGILQLNTGL
jgi:hypothetical protein